MIRVLGESMIEAGIADDDVLIVDRAQKPEHGSIVVTTVDGEFTVKYLRQRLLRSEVSQRAWEAEEKNAKGLRGKDVMGRLLGVLVFWDLWRVKPCALPQQITAL